MLIMTEPPLQRRGHRILATITRCSKLFTVIILTISMMLTPLDKNKFHGSLLFISALPHLSQGRDLRDAFQSYQYFPEAEKEKMRREVKRMFYFGYDNYMRHAFPQDELNPIYCNGRGPDIANPENLNINDVLGNYSLTLIDTLDTLAVLGNASEFKRAVQLVTETVSFDSNSVVQVFEANIRVIGGLLSAHLLIKDTSGRFGNLRPKHYNDDLLNLAHDLARRLLPAFSKSRTGIPWPRINLMSGLNKNMSTSTCPAGAGTLVLELGILSALVGDPTFEFVARKSMDALWNARSANTGLVGNAFDMQSGNWTGKMSGLGAGIDSYYEYLLKSYILFGEQGDLEKFDVMYKNIKRYMRKGRDSCLQGSGETPMYVNVNMETGSTFNTWIDSLQAAFSGVQVLRGDIDEAICSHLVYYALWQRYGAMPERFNWHSKEADVKFYPLRPELVESTYLLYQATGHPFYLHVGSEIFQSIDAHTKVECGYATVHDVEEKSLEDRMESFFLSETCKYLYLLFDTENPLNKYASDYIFSTEGHFFRIDPKLRRSKNSTSTYIDTKRSLTGIQNQQGNVSMHCSSYERDNFWFYPLNEKYFNQVKDVVGLM